MEKRLYRPADDRVLAGVCSGIAQYFGLDPALVRLGWVLLTFFAGFGFVPYIVAWGVMPDESGERAALPWILVVLLVGLPFACAAVFLCWGMFLAMLGAN